MRKLYLFAVFVVGAMLLLTTPFFKWSAILIHTKAHGLEKLEPGEKELWIEIHDVSPSYGYEKLDEILRVIEKHQGGYEKVVLFVIPNHGGKAPLHKYPEFTAKLKELQERGYILGVHGYTHLEPLKHFEFDCSVEEASGLLSRIQYEFNESGLELPSYFVPPAWRTSYSVDDYLRSNFEYVYYLFYIDTPRGTLPYNSHEYIWHELELGSLAQAKKDYENTEGVFRFTMHVGAVNNEKGLEFIDEFLSWVAKQ